MTKQGLIQILTDNKIGFSENMKKADLELLIEKNKIDITGYTETSEEETTINTEIKTDTVIQSENKTETLNTVIINSILDENFQEDNIIDIENITPVFSGIYLKNGSYETKDGKRFEQAVDAAIYNAIKIKEGAF